MNKLYVTDLPAVILYGSRQMNSIKLMLRRSIHRLFHYSANESSRYLSGSLPKGRTLVRFVLYSVFSLGAFSLNGQRVLTIEDAIALALKNNYDIQLSRNDSAIAALDYSYRNWLFAPRLNASVGNVWNNNHQNQEFTNGSKREGDVKTDNLAGSVTL